MTAHRKQAAKKSAKNHDAGSAHPTTQATLALDAAGIAWTPHTYTHDARAESYGLEAAAALDIPAERLFKTLIVTLDGKPGVAIIPVEESLNLKSAAKALAGAGAPKVKTAEMATEQLAQRATGYVVGGISPLGMKRALPTALDISAKDHDTILVSGGRRGFSVEVRPGDIVRITGAAFAPLTR